VLAELPSECGAEGGADRPLGESSRGAHSLTVKVMTAIRLAGQIKVGAREI